VLDAFFFFSSLFSALLYLTLSCHTFTAV